MEHQVNNLKPNESIEAQLTRYFSTMLRVPVAQIRTDLSVLELGADSIMLVEAQRWMRDKFGCEIEVKEFFDNLNSIQAIAAFIQQNGSLPKRLDLQETQTLGLEKNLRHQQIDHTVNSALTSADYALMQSQLVLALDVIEKQNKLVIAKLKNGTVFESS